MTEANRLVVGKLLRDFCRLHHVRNSDAVRLVPVATVFCFVPNNAEVEAAEMMRSNPVLEQLYAGQGHGAEPLGLVHRIGRWLGFKPRASRMTFGK
jgi:hypothetical protein